MEIVKKNIISIICGVVALAAVVVAFVIVPGHQEQLQANVKTSQAAYESVNTLLTKPRQLPVVNPDNPEQKQLEQFPSETVIKQGEAITKKVEEESKAILAAAVEMNKHRLLVEGSLPAPFDPQKYQFRKGYQIALPLPPQGGAMKSAFAAELNAGMPPTPDEMRLAAEALVKDIETRKLVFTAQGQPANGPQVKAEIDEATRKLPIGMRDKIAGGSRVYINPDTFEINPRITNAAGNAPDTLEIYSAQLSYWIQSDVVAAVKEINANSKGVAESPVKHLIRIRTKPYGQAGPIFLTGPDGSAAADANGTLPKVPQASTTGRVSNGLYDVFHFEVEADVEAAKLPDFLRGLGNRRFITPLFVDVKAKDNATALAEGHVYGNKPVVNVRAECEVLYLRVWNSAFMPQALKTKLGIAAPAADGSAPAAQPAAAADPAVAPAGAPGGAP
ncbi:MAG: hypothetical protein QOF78_1919 [Phycisphaerales bacterium]|jgi:hypothetical protein|nr:hypothetical protein [Phycisphaerales bacterium]